MISFAVIEVAFCYLSYPKYKLRTDVIHFHYIIVVETSVRLKIAVSFIA